MRSRLPRRGEEWALRTWHDEQHEFTRVLVVDETQGAIDRYFVIFPSENEDERHERVHRTHLVAPWELREEFLRTEIALERIKGAGSLVGRPEAIAVESVFDLVIDPRSAHQIEDDRWGITVVTDLERLAAALGLRPEMLTDDDDAFWDAADLVVPWPITRLIVTAACKRFAPEIRAAVQVWEARRALRARLGTDLLEPADAASLDDEVTAPAFELLKAWTYPPLSDAPSADVESRLIEIEALVGSLRHMVANSGPSAQ